MARLALSHPRNEHEGRTELLAASCRLMAARAITTTLASGAPKHTFGPSDVKCLRALLLALLVLRALLALLALGKCPRETTVVPTPTKVARAGQHRATSWRLAALPLTTKLAYELPNTRLVPRTPSAREPRCWRYWRHWLCYLPRGP